MCLCEDIDECRGDDHGACGPEDKAINCDNTEGSFSCDCRRGYEFNGETCAGWLSHVTALTGLHSFTRNTHCMNACHWLTHTGTPSPDCLLCHYYPRQRAYVFIGVSLFVCLLAELRKTTETIFTNFDCLIETIFRYQRL